jgi:hypothetical protein
MALQAFTKSFEDNSTEAGFQFTFKCDICGSPYKSQFIPSESYKKGSILRNLGSAASFAASLSSKIGNAGYTASRGADTLAQKYQGMTPEWHKEHDEAFTKAQNEAMNHFKQCPKCHKYVDEKDWNEQQGLCVEDAQKPNVGTAATGATEGKQIICPVCGKPAGSGKFCNNCGAPLTVNKCPNCGMENPVGAKFCGACGAKLA